MTTPIRSPRKLIEVALPLDDINEAAAREKSIRHGHPSTLHLWWARRPLTAARAVLFAQLVNDPGYETGDGFTRGMNKKDAARERERLFNIIRRLVHRSNTKSIDQTCFAELGRSSGWRSPIGTFFRFRRRTCSLACRYSRSTRLSFTPHPACRSFRWIIPTPYRLCR
jgi:hypothetical protein